MTTLLHLDSSPLQTSISRELTREFTKTWKAAHADGTVIYRDLARHPPSPLDAIWIGAAYTPKDSRTPAQVAALKLSDELIEELNAADEYVLGVAMHNFSIPSVLKLWIDQVVRSGRTFANTADGLKGLLEGKKALILVASGWAYEAGTPAASMNFIEPYLRSLLAFIGITDVKFVNAGGAAKVMTGAVDRETFLKPTLEQVRLQAA